MGLALEVSPANAASLPATREPARTLASTPWVPRRSYAVRPPSAWTIEPGVGIGPLRVGMRIDDAIRVLDELALGPVEQAQKGSAIVRRVGPSQILGVLSAPDCTEDAEADRVLLAVDATGASSVVSSSTLWKGATDCE